MGLAGGADNDRGMAGIAFGVDPVANSGKHGPGTSLGGDAWARAIDWVRTADSGGRRKVIILEVQTGSFGNYEKVPSVNAAIRTAIAAGVVVCVAAGNGNRDAGIDDRAIHSRDRFDSGGCDRISRDAEPAGRIQQLGPANRRVARRGTAATTSPAPLGPTARTATGSAAPRAHAQGRRHRGADALRQSGDSRTRRSGRS